jgi:cholesterol oxidase
MASPSVQWRLVVRRLDATRGAPVYWDAAGRSGCPTTRTTRSRHHRPPSHGAAPLSRRFESLLAEGRQLACDVLVIGSGYGGSFAALELAAPGRSVWVFERGREYALGEFPETLGELPGHVQFTRGADGRPRGNRDALCDVRIDESCVSVVGCGLGGTSLINAGVVLEPHPDVLSDPRWPAAIRSGPAMLREAFREVERLLGAAPYPSPERFAKYRALQRLARGIPGAVCEPAVIAVASRDGPNPAGVEQRACLDCGNCVTGCNHGAKNTLPMNVIPLAKARGAEFFTGATAVRVRRVAPGAPASGDGARWIVRFRRTAAMKAEDDPGLFERPVEPESFEIRANLVVIAAARSAPPSCCCDRETPGWPCRHAWASGSRPTATRWTSGTRSGTRSTRSAR